METPKHTKPIDISLYYLFVYMSTGTFFYLSVYLRTGPKFDMTQIGYLQAIGPLVAMIAPYFWGLAADKAASRNTVWFILVAGAALSALLFPLNKSFLYAAFAMVIYNIFNTSFSPIQDSIATELCEREHWGFGRVRTWGTIGYAVTTFAVGTLLPTDGPAMFIAYAALFLLALIPIARLPKVTGGQSHGVRVPYRQLFHNRQLVLLFAVNFVIFLTSGYYYSFYSVYFISDEVGGTSALLGVCNALASLSEFPFMLYADRIVRRFGLRRTMMGSIVLLTLRWLLIGLFPNPVALILANTLHGFSYAAIYYCGVVYINDVVDPAFKSSGQAFNGIICAGVTKVIASIGGGYLSTAFGFRAMFITSGLLLLLLLAAMLVYVRRRRTA